ncbi:hypothetical protein [Desertivibrio insolitus]|uniref:hypothetical protein n=1 Tax=Herbiconiux sp. SYSU D00978 TaxID=2812562 RepID=UPI001F60BAE7|nr:hypothetical protein [Herbiconiux sp. SYSU D00978]
MIAVIGVLAIAAVIAVTVSASTIGALATTSSSRASIQARAAAEAGINAATAGLRTINDCADPGIAGVDTTAPAGTYRSTATSDVHFVATVESFQSGTWSASCPVTATTQVRVTSVGQAQHQGVAGATSGDEVTLQAIFDYDPIIVQVPVDGSAVYAHTIVGTLKNFELNTESNSVATSVSIKNGNVVCTNGAEIGGDLLLGNGNATLDMCDVAGSVHVKGNLSINKSAIGSNVSATGTGVVTNSTIGGTRTFGSLAAAPNIPDWTDVNWDPAYWTGRGYTVTNWTGSCSISKSTTEWKNLANITTPTVINFLSKCPTTAVTTSSNMDEVELDANLVFVGHQFDFTKFYFGTDAPGEHRTITFIVPDNTPDGLPTCAPPAGLNGGIRLNNEADFTAGVSAMMYTPCKIYSDRNGYRGQLYGGEIEFGQQASLTFAPVGIEGFDLTGGATNPVQAGSQLGSRLSLKEVPTP